MNTESQQQEWTPVGDNSIKLSDGTFVTCYNRISRDVVLRAHNAALTAERQARNLMTQDALNLKKELTAERQRRERAESKAGKYLIAGDVIRRECEKLEQQLLSALAALKELQDERDKDKNLPKV